jgi:acyl-coenzyme A synthetase/AMP-(fatty) acid ligase
VALANAGQDGHDLVVTFAGAADPETCADGAERVRADPGPDLAAPVLILFTSGTTGWPKGATFTQENMTFNALNVITAFGLTARLAIYKHPRDVIFLDALPRNAVGKVQKTVLRDLVSKAGGRGRALRSVRYQREFPSWHSGAGE